MSSAPPTSNPNETTWGQNWGVGVIISVVATMFIYYATRSYVQRSRTKRRVLRREDPGGDGIDADSNGTASRALPAAMAANTGATSASASANNEGEEMKRKATIESVKGNGDIDQNRTDVVLNLQRHASSNVNAKSQAKNKAQREILELEHPELKRMGLIKISLAMFIALVLDFSALAMISLSLIAPLTMFYFIWRTLSSWIRREEKIFLKSQIFIFVVNVIAMAMVIYGGPHTMSILNIDQVFAIDSRLIIYAACFAFLMIAPFIIIQSSAATSVVALIIGLSINDFQAITYGFLAGISCGQYMLLLKLLGEIAEASIFGGATNGNAASTFFVLAVAVVLGLFHIYLIRAGLRLKNENLVIPVYRLALIASGLTAALVFLNEFNGMTAEKIAIYSVGFSLAALVLIYMIRNSLIASKRGDMDSRLRMAGSGLDRDGDDIDIEMGDYSESNLPSSIVGSLKGMNAGKRNPSGAKEKTLAGGGRSYIYKPKNGKKNGSGIDQQSDDGFVSVNEGSQSSIGKSNRGRTVSESAAAMLSFVTGSSGANSSRNGKHRNEEGIYEDDDEDYDDDNGSFHSLPSTSTPRAYSIAKSEYDYHYDPPKATMVCPKGHFNPYAPEGASYWWDCGAVPGLFKVRGPNYLVDGVKIKAEQSSMVAVALEWSYNPVQPIRHISQHPEGLIQTQHVGKPNRPFLFVLNFMVPTVGNHVVYFAKRENYSDPLFDFMFKQYIEGDDENRNKRFKIIPT